MKDEKRLIILGAGGAGLKALAVARRAHAGWVICGFADDSAALGDRQVDGVPVLGSVADTLARMAGRGVWFHCGIGNNHVRRKLAELAEAAGFLPATLIDPTAVVDSSARIGAGSYVAPMMCVGPEARVGRHVLLNVGASVAHHCVVGDFAQVCPGARLSGNVTLGVAGFVGSNGVLAPGITVGDGATVGASSFAARDVPPGATVLGVPARVLVNPSNRDLNI